MQSSMQHAMQHAACRADKGSMQHGNAAHSMNFAEQTEPAQGAKMGGKKIILIEKNVWVINNPKFGPYSHYIMAPKKND